MDDRNPQQRKPPDRLSLFEIASDQAGYFLAEQAHRCGYSRALLSHYLKSGRFIRVRRGLYRLVEYPSSRREHVLAAWLAVGKDVAVVSHESALDLLNLSDIIPNAVHLTVPRTHRSFPPLPGVKVHTIIRPIAPNERWMRDGMVITSATRSVLDAAEAGSAPEQIEMAIIQAVERGQVIPEELNAKAGERSWRVAALVEGALQRSRMGERQDPLPAWDNLGKPSSDEKGGEPMQVKEELARFQDDMAYFDQHREELLERYPEKWVAIYDQKVVGAAKALPTLVAQLERKGLRGKAFVDYVTEREDLLIL